MRTLILLWLWNSALYPLPSAQTLLSHNFLACPDTSSTSWKQDELTWSGLVKKRDLARPAQDVSEQSPVQQLSWLACQPRTFVCSWPAGLYPENINKNPCSFYLCHPLSLLCWLSLPVLLNAGRTSAIHNSELTKLTFPSLSMRIACQN